MTCVKVVIVIIVNVQEWIRGFLSFGQTPDSESEKQRIMIVITVIMTDWMIVQLGFNWKSHADALCRIVS